MTAPRMRARDFLTEDQLIAVRQRSTWKGVGLIVHAWALILGSIALVAWWPNPMTYLLAVGIIGSRQLGLAILMHDGAHGCLSPDETANLRLSQWFCAYPIFAVITCSIMRGPSRTTIPTSCCRRRFRSRG
jgi:fatty acid desaturase